MELQKNIDFHGRFEEIKIIFLQAEQILQLLAKLP